MLYRLKAQFQKLAALLGQSWLTANQASGLGALAAVAYAAAFYLGLARPGWRALLLTVPLLGLLRMIMNALDGMLARAQGTASPAGEIANELLDVGGDTVMYGGLYFVPGGPDVSLVIFLLLCWAGEFVSVLGKSLPGGFRRQESVLGGKPERAVWFGILALVLYFNPGFLGHLPAFLWGLNTLVLFTILARVRAALRDSRGTPYQSTTLYGK